MKTVTVRIQVQRETAISGKYVITEVHKDKFKVLGEYPYNSFNEMKEYGTLSKAVAFDEARRLQYDFIVKFEIQ